MATGREPANPCPCGATAGSGAAWRHAAFTGRMRHPPIRCGASAGCDTGLSMTNPHLCCKMAERRSKSKARPALRDGISAVRLFDLMGVLHADLDAGNGFDGFPPLIGRGCSNCSLCRTRSPLRQRPPSQRRCERLAVQRFGTNSRNASIMSDRSSSSWLQLPASSRRPMLSSPRKRAWVA